MSNTTDGSHSYVRYGVRVWGSGGWLVQGPFEEMDDAIAWTERLLRVLPDTPVEVVLDHVHVGAWQTALNGIETVRAVERWMTTVATPEGDLMPTTEHEYPAAGEVVDNAVDLLQRSGYTVLRTPPPALLYVHGKQSFSTVAYLAEDTNPTTAMPAWDRDILRALLTLTLRQLDEPTEPPIDFLGARDMSTELFPCGHTAVIRGCGGCDPGAVSLVREDGGSWRRPTPSETTLTEDELRQEPATP